MRDLGLSYEAAMHGVQSAVKYEMEARHRDIRDDIKHLRVGIDARAADAFGLASLLIDKELARYTDHVRETYGLPDGVEFR